VSNRSGFQKAVNGAQIAKGIANIIKGAATGGLHGAAAAAAKSFAPQLIKLALIISVVLILLPIIVISALPSVLFGWATVPAQDLKDRKEYATVMETCYNQVSTYRQEVVDEIVEENKGDADEVIINDDNTPMDIYWIISIDGVGKKQDVYNLNEREIKKLIRNSLIVEVEREERTSEDETTIVVTITITTKSPEQIMEDEGYDEDHKNWARLLYNTTTNPQALSEADSDYVGSYGSDYAGVTFTDGATTVVYFNQLDKAWADTLYGRAGTIGKEGCGPTALAIVVSTLTSRTVNPVEVSNWSAANGHRCVGSGSYHSLIPSGAEHYGLKVEKAGRAGNGQVLVDALSSGKLVIAIMNPGHFTKSGHFIVLRGVTASGKILVADPASYTRSGQEWDLSTILREARPDAGAGGPFWICSK